MVDRTFPVSGPVELNCEFRSGSLTIKASEQLSQATVSVRPRQADTAVDQLFRVELTGDRLNVVERPENGDSLLQAVLGGDLRTLARNRIFGRTEVDLVVELPAGSTVRVSVLSADIIATGRIGATSLSCGSSDVEFDVVDGSLQVRGGSGTLSVNRLAGSGNVRGGSGRVRIGEAAAPLSVAVGSGEVEIGVAHGTVRCRSGSGSTSVEQAEQDVDIASSAGPVTIGLRAGQQARLDVATGSGRLRTEMPLQDSPRAGDAITIRARTGSGDIIVRRAEL
ncbi:MAG: DUF4097 family beta strand repeat-containing protein [Jatrophihabitantaceae bacterium]